MITDFACTDPSALGTISKRCHTYPVCIIQLWIHWLPIKVGISEVSI